jgi:hypothetical protein
LTESGNLSSVVDGEPTKIFVRLNRLAQFGGGLLEATVANRYLLGCTYDLAYITAGASLCGGRRFPEILSSLHSIGDAGGDDKGSQSHKKMPHLPAIAK